VNIFVVRHGETAQNRARVMQRPEDPLSELGLRQADALARRLAALGVAKILTSDYARARMTAEAVGAAAGIEPEVEELLRERNFGDLRGMPYSQLPADPFAADYHPPNGESAPTFTERVARAFARITTCAEALDGNLCVVTHGLVCRGLVEHFEVSVPVPAAWGNTALTVVEARAPWRVETIACTVHLGEGGEMSSSQVARVDGGAP